MPKIEVNEKLFFSQLGKRYDFDLLEKKLTCAKAELDEKPDLSEAEDKRVIKIELNDTNRPDLWSTNGVARQLRLHSGGKTTDYTGFLSYSGKIKDCKGREIFVDPELKDIRPYLAAFVISGKPIDEPMLMDIIQTQEKLCWNFGRKRKSVSMGVYRLAGIKFPVHYRAVDPDNTNFVPLQFEDSMSCRNILLEHPKGKEFGHIIKDYKKFPLLSDDKGEVLSMPPIINSASLGAVQVGDSDLMVELTGDNIENLILSANIVACDFADCGYKIEPVMVHHPYETGLGKDVAVPFYFQAETKALLSSINKLLGVNFDKEKVINALSRMGSTVSSKNVEIHGKEDVEFTVCPAPYRNDFLHEVDIIEDVMIGADLDSFEAAKPKDFTIGRLLPITELSRETKTLMVGLGYQEMIFNYVGSKKDYIENMNFDSAKVIEIENPMSENYQFIRPEMLSSLLRAESKSAGAVYPHKIFEIGKVAYLCKSENTGTKTSQNLGFLTAAATANFNDAASEISSLLYFLDYKYEVKESSDSRFIAGRQAAITVDGREIGVFGEIHPEILEKWAIEVPCVGGEINLEELLPCSECKNEKKEQTEKSPKNENSDSGLAENQVEHYNKFIDMRVAKIIKVERNPEGEKLYIEHLDDGSGNPRIIQSGLVPYLKPEELLNKHIILVSNLAPRKMRGVESRGMLLAADYTEDGMEKVEVLTAPWAAPGTPVILEGASPDFVKPQKIDIDKFCKVKINISEFTANISGVSLTTGGKPIKTSKARNGNVD